ncbi:MAG TPA: hypothetical protein VF720_03585, partial [Candidatus Eisenbacteria bacterium]
MTYETGLDAITELVRWASEHVAERNEATTRLHLIDTLLLKCLGWPMHMVEAEKHFRKEYSDYELGEPSKLLLVEAKREGIYFELPHGFGQEVCRLETLAGLNVGIGDAIKQAMEYAQSRGIPVAAVTNGHQLIAFIASRQDGVPPSKGEAIVFESLEAIRTRFRQFWNCLSPS